MAECGKCLVAMPRHKSILPPPRLRCPVCGAIAHHLFYHSTYITRDGPRSLFKCKLCGKCLSERRGTAFFNLKTPEREVTSCLNSMTRATLRLPLLKHAITSLTPCADGDAAPLLMLRP